MVQENYCKLGRYFLEVNRSQKSRGMSSSPKSVYVPEIFTWKLHWAVFPATSDAV